MNRGIIGRGGGDWRDHLATLPDAAPPPQLRERVLAAMASASPRAATASSRRRNRAPLWLGGAMAASLALVALVVMRPATHTAPVAGPADAIARSQALEASLLARGDASAFGASVAEIDRALSAAYRRDAGDAELAALWQARARALEQGITQAPAQPVRI